MSSITDNMTQTSRITPRYDGVSRLTRMAAIYALRLCVLTHRHIFPRCSSTDKILQLWGLKRTSQKNLHGADWRFHAQDWTCVGSGRYAKCCMRCLQQDGPHDVQLNARNPWRVAAEAIDCRQCRVMSVCVTRSPTSAMSLSWLSEFFCL